MIILDIHSKLLYCRGSKGKLYNKKKFVDSVYEFIFGTLKNNTILINYNTSFIIIDGKDWKTNIVRLFDVFDEKTGEIFIYIKKYYDKIQIDNEKYNTIPKIDQFINIFNECSAYVFNKQINNRCTPPSIPTPIKTINTSNKFSPLI